jgi:hypothetical protein
MTYLRKAIAAVIGLAALLSILILVLYSNPEFQFAVNLLIGSMIGVVICSAEVIVRKGN